MTRPLAEIWPGGLEAPRLKSSHAVLVQLPEKIQHRSDSHRRRIERHQEVAHICVDRRDYTSPRLSHNQGDENGCEHQLKQQNDRRPHEIRKLLDHDVNGAETPIGASPLLSLFAGRGSAAAAILEQPKNDTQNDKANNAIRSEILDQRRHVADHISEERKRSANEN